MAIIKLGPDNFELVTLATHPVRSYTSSSSGVTGSVHVFARRSSYEKEAQSITAFDETKLEANSLEDLRLACINSAKQPTRARADIQFTGVPEDGDILIVTDTLGKSVYFEFDTHSPTSMVSQSIAQRVNINHTGSATSVANTFIDVVNKVSNFEIHAKPRVVSGEAGHIRLIQKKGGASGNTTISTQYQKNASGSVQNLTLPSKFVGGSDAGEFRSAIELYMSGVRAEPESPRNQKAMELFRFEPSFKFTKDTGRKNVVKNVVMPYHRVRYPTSHYAFTNYQSLNFFTASYVPSDKALLYPNYFPDNSTFGPYTPDKGFTLSFYVNPRRATLKSADSYIAGCIMHLSSTFAVSLVTGSRKDEEGKPSNFRIMLQLSHSADVSPSNVTYTPTSNVGSSGGTSNYPNNLIFLSKDNILKKNHWHHVAIRWGSRTFNAGTGSFVIDGIQRGEFVVPSASIAPLNKAGSGNTDTADPQALVIGNYFEGNNHLTSSSNIVQFFNPNANSNEGVRSLAAANNDPTNFSFQHPLNAEIHDIRIYNKYLTTPSIVTASMQGPKNYKGMLFYLPVLFTKESPKRNNLLTPFQTTRSSTDDPFNVSLSFGVGGHLVNCENYLREFVQKEYPRMYNLTASVVDGAAQVELTMNEYLYATGSVRARNLLVLPSDNGLFRPNYELLKSGTFSSKPKTSHEMGKFVNDLGNLDLSLVTLNDLILTSTLIGSLTNDESEIASQIMGSNPDNLGQAPGVVLTIYQRTRDNSSNQVVFFDASNLFYGKRIKPGSVRMHDPGLTGSIDPLKSGELGQSGVVPMTLRDNGLGNLYRADTLSTPAKWASVGNVYYDEGIMLVKSPNIPLFGKDKHIIDFKGEHDVHVMKVLVKAPAGQINSSSNPTYLQTSASVYANENSENFVYITGINFHDDNFNIITKSVFAQPIVKRDTDEFLFKSKIDF